jgi:osomolarity two-component system response regulator SSK1
VCVAVGSAAGKGLSKMEAWKFKALRNRMKRRSTTSSETSRPVDGNINGDSSGGDNGRRDGGGSGGGGGALFGGGGGGSGGDGRGRQHNSLPTKHVEGGSSSLRKAPSNRSLASSTRSRLSHWAKFGRRQGDGPATGDGVGDASNAKQQQERSSTNTTLDTTTTTATTTTRTTPPPSTSSCSTATAAVDEENPPSIHQPDEAKKKKERRKSSLSREFKEVEDEHDPKEEEVCEEPVVVAPAAAIQIAADTSSIAAPPSPAAVPEPEPPIQDQERQIDAETTDTTGTTGTATATTTTTITDVGIAAEHNQRLGIPDTNDCLPSVDGPPSPKINSTNPLSNSTSVARSELTSQSQSTPAAPPSSPLAFSVNPPAHSPTSLNPTSSPPPSSPLPTAVETLPATPTLPTSVSPLFGPDRSTSLRRDISLRAATGAVFDPPHRPSQVIRRQSILPAGTTGDSRFITDLYFGKPALQGETEQPDMSNRKIWVKRPNASPTSVVVSEEDMVDDVRDLILVKYQNSLGRFWDAPDVMLRIVPRGGRPRGHDRGHDRRHDQGHDRGHDRHERLLSPDEQLVRVLDDYYPGGQTADDALIIEVPERKTPRPSPNHAQSYAYGTESHGVPDDYFSQTPAPARPPTAQRGTPDSQRVQPIPSPGAYPRDARDRDPRDHSRDPRDHSRDPRHSQDPREHRPRLGQRMTTSPPAHPPTHTPILLGPKQHPHAGRSRGGSDVSASNGGQPPPLPPVKPTSSEEDTSQKPRIPSPAVGSPAGSGKKIKEKKQPNQQPSAGIHTDGTVPPIKVLIVEDNVINLRLLEAFMKRLKVRWEAAMNGKIAVEKWRAGGFHLVLMDIQLPVMNGLEATKEIRRLEKVNRIRGAFPHTGKLDDGDEVEEEETYTGEIPEEDRLPDSILFRSPVIIVALTASSLQSDRHEAYAAGCNDFLTKVCCTPFPGSCYCY